MVSKHAGNNNACSQCAGRTRALTRGAHADEISHMTAIAVSPDAEYANDEGTRLRPSAQPSEGGWWWIGGSGPAAQSS